jgi:hypothetical protein
MPPRTKARIAGAFYFLSVVSAILAEKFVHGKMLYATGLVPVSCFTVTTLLLYAIFKPVSRSASLLALISNLASLAVEALELHFGHVNVALVLHGIYCLAIAFLILKSTLLPRILSLPMALAGLAWTMSFLPGLADRFHAPIQMAGFAGEGLAMLWLLVRGVHAAR